MGSLSNAILKGNTKISGETTIMGKIKANNFYNAGGSITGTFIASTATYVDNIVASTTTPTTKQYFLGVTASNGAASMMVNTSVYISNNVIYADGFSGTATNASALNAQPISYYVETGKTERWWRYSNMSRTLGAQQTCYLNSLYDMHSSTNTVATSTTVKVGDYIFSQDGAIGTITSIASTSVYARITWVSCQNWTCIEKGTMITMADWSQKAIEDINYGEMIMGYDFEKNEPTPAVAIICDATVKSENNSFYVFSNGQYLNCTDDHEIYSVDKKCNVFARDLKEGDRCLSSNGEVIRVQAIHRYIGELGLKQFYQLISSNNTYFANGILNAMGPINKYNWMRRKFGQNIPDEIMKILREDSIEFGCYEFLAKNEEFRKKSVNIMKELKIRNNKIRKLKSFLNDTDYVVIKKSEGKEIDKSIIDNRKNARKEINNLEDEIKNIYQPMHDKLISEYSDLGEDILLSHEERRSKYFFKACKIDNDNLRIFKKHFGPGE